MTSCAAFLRPSHVHAGMEDHAGMMTTELHSNLCPSICRFCEHARDSLVEGNTLSPITIIFIISLVKINILNVPLCH